MEETKFCPKCGNIVKNDDDFCEVCGYNLAHDRDKIRRKEEKIEERDRRYNDDRSHTQTAVVALLFGCLSFIYTGIIFGPLAIYFGNKERKFDSYAKAGFILGIIGTTVSALELIITILVLILPRFLI